MKAKTFKKHAKSTGFSDSELKMLEFYPPDQEKKQKASKSGVDLSFKVTLEVQHEVYEEFYESLKHFVGEFTGVKIR